MYTLHTGRAVYATLSGVSADHLQEVCILKGSGDVGLVGQGIPRAELAIIRTSAFADIMS